MPWFNVDDGFANSKPVLRIPRRYRCAAVGLWTLAGSWSAKELTDGFIPDHALEEFASTPAMATLLVKADLWTEVAGGWQFNNWAKYQKTKEQVYAYRAAEAERKRKQRSGGKPPGGGGVSHPDSGRTEPAIPSGLQAESEVPIPVPIPNHSSLGDLGGGVTSVDGSEPPRYCEKHPNDTTDYCRRCVVLRKRHDAWKDQQAQREADEVERQRQKREALAQRLKACPQCDEDGWRYDDREIKCKHQEAM